MLHEVAGPYVHVTPREAGVSEPDRAEPLAQPPDVGGRGGPAWERLEDQLGWYDRKSTQSQLAYRRVKLAELVVASVVPVVAALAHRPP